MALADAMLSETEKTFQYQQELPPLPVPDLHHSLDRYLDSVKPFITDKEYKETERIVREFGAGVGHHLHQKLLQKAKNKRNWLERWWQDHAYLELRVPTGLFVNMAGPGPYVTDIWPAKDGTQCERSALMLHFMVKFWKILREERLKPQKDGQGKPLCMNQFHRLYNTCRIPGVSMDSLKFYFQTESEGPAPSHLIVTCRGHIFCLECLDPDGEVLTAPEIQKQLEVIREKCDHIPPGQALGNLTADDRTHWAQMRNHLIARSPQNYEKLEKIQQSLFVLDLTDQSPSSINELAWLGLGGSADNKFFDKSLNISSHKNGLFCSNCDHTPFEAMVLVVSTYYCHLRMKDLGGKWKGSTAVRKLSPPEELVFDLDSVIEQRIAFVKENFAKQCQMVEVEASAFRGYGKDYIKSMKVHPDAYVQLGLHYAYYKKYRRPAPAYQTATVRKFYHGRTETLRSCTNETVDWSKAMLDPRCSHQRRLELFHRAVDRHGELMDEAQDMRGCDRLLFALYMQAKEDNMPVPEVFTDPTYVKSGGGGNYILSTSSIGYTSVYGGVSPMCRNGYGCFYKMGPDEIVTFVSAWTIDEDTSAKGYTQQLHECLRDMQALLEHKRTVARL